MMKIDERVEIIFKLREEDIVFYNTGYGKAISHYKWTTEKTIIGIASHEVIECLIRLMEIELESNSYSFHRIDIHRLIGGVKGYNGYSKVLKPSHYENNTDGLPNLDQPQAL